jgi:monothiol glutaredoxin
MAESEADLTDPRQVANVTFAYLRRIENQLTKVMEILLRHETRPGRVERDIGEVKRDVGEVKSDIVLLENRLLTQMNEFCHRFSGSTNPNAGSMLSRRRHRNVNKEKIMAIDQFIDNEVKSNDVVLFMKGTPQFPMCGFSGQVVQILDYIGVPYKGLNVLENEELRNGIKIYSNWPTIPQLYVKGEFVGGCDIVREMFQAGELQGLMKDKGLPVKEAASA